MLRIKPLSDVTSLVVLKIPQLFVQTRRLAEKLPLVEILAHSEPDHIWLRNGFGALGFGTITDFKISANSANPAARFKTAQKWWEELAAQTTIDDEVQAPGSGLFAFGSFSFTENSPKGSTLLIPQILLFSTKNESWITITADSQTKLASLSEEATEIISRSLKKASVNKSEQKKIHGKFQLSEIHELPETQLWLQQVDTTIKRIESGVAEKIVLSRSIKLQVNQEQNNFLSAPRIAQRLAQNYPNTWIFGVDNLVGATPELLIGRDAERTYSRVLAGTISRETNLTLAELSSQLQGSEKDQHEHEIARDSVIAALRKFGEISAESPYILELPNVLHLASDIELHPTQSDIEAPNTESNAEALNTEEESLVNQNPQKHFAQPAIFSILAKLHPSAALGGSPREAALAAITEIETVDRGRYGAPVGWIARSNFAGSAKDYGQWCIALRCAQILSPFELQAWAGGGIMIDSIPEKELAETTAKFRPIRDLFA
ncbi:MAG: chorismate-binding protein [Arcanobacterium sp.]|nr:chorismate-binding protein [Arcanobacterium sp.]